MVWPETSISPEKLPKYQRTDSDFLSRVTREDTSSWDQPRYCTGVESIAWWKSNLDRVFR